MIGVIFIAVAFGVALRRVRHEPIHTVADAIDDTNVSCLLDGKTRAD